MPLSLGEIQTMNNDVMLSVSGKFGVSGNEPQLSGFVPYMPARKFNEAIAYLGKKLDRPYKANSGGTPKATRVIRTESGIGVRYHETIVVEYLPEGIKLNSGGYRTMTTKERINEALSALPVRVSVSQTAGVWYIGASKRNSAYTESSIRVDNPNYDPTLPNKNRHFDGVESNWEFAYDANPDHDPDQPYSLPLWSMPYFDGLIVGYDGSIVNPPEDNGASESERIQRTNRLINAYVKETMSRIKRVNAMTESDFDGDVLPMPSGGDCWHCLMRNNQGTGLGDLTHSDHLIRHLEECYIVPSLLLNAIREYETRQYKISSRTLQCLMEGNVPDKWGVDMLLRDMPRAIRKYFKTRLAIAGR